MRSSMEEYVSTLLAQIADPRARIDIEQEIRQHLEDQINCYRKDGMNEEDAMELAVKDMGDPVQTGVELNHIHRPKTAWRMVLLILIISFLVLALKCTYYHNVFDSSMALYYCHRELVFSCIGITLMLGINYLDYSRIGKHGRGFMLFVLGGIVLGTFLSPEVIHGQRYIYLPGGITLSPGYIILLTLPLYGGILYVYRRGNLKSILLCIGWALLPGIVLAFLSGTILTPLVLLVINMFTLVIVLSKGWFNVSAKKCITFLISGILGILALFLGSCYFLGGYRRQMILAWFAPQKYDSGFLLNHIRSIIVQSKWIGSNELADPYFQRQVMEHHIGEYMLSFMASYYGVMVMLLLFVLIFGLFSYIYCKIWKQKNLLGKLMGTSCCVTLMMQIILYLLTNVGLLYNNYIGCPFLNCSFSCTIVDYAFLGILLSILRYQYVLPVAGSGNADDDLKEKHTVKKLILNGIKVEKG